MNTYYINITGRVQGVGFRPFVYQLAQRLSLVGEVRNGVQGVEIWFNGEAKTRDAFVNALQSEHPPLAQIDILTCEAVSHREFTGFSIVESGKEGAKTTLIPPDISICAKCEAELFDPKNRRYLYPLITCTDCGVRYSIIENLPYDRKHTSMKKFRMCKACEEEYNDPKNRRYHAQPIGCWECGPKLELRVKEDVVELNQEEIVAEAVSLLKVGKIVAVKGVGGYHLMCDATNETTLKKLRERKRRPTKPFAVMVRDIETAKSLASVSPLEEELLLSKERPIVLLHARRSLPAAIAPNISKIGLFLPYTPLHLLLLEGLERPLVATSANLTDEPIATDEDSIGKLETVYDALLTHDREIVNGCDDSVMMVVKNQPIMIRRARGFAPSSVKLPFALKKKVLALGANQKSIVAIGFDKEIILSPHIGDLDTIESLGYFEKNIQTLERIYDFKPDVVVHDRHPNYESTKYAKSHYQDTHAVQHHYAHILGVMAEKRIEGRVLGVAFDGTGYGDNGTLWGGEFLVCDYGGFERVAHLKYFKLLGGAKAIKEPKRVALSLLFDLYGEEALSLQNPTTNAFSQSELKNLYRMWQKGLNAPLSSSMGRLFDAVASLTGVCQTMSFEGESGMLLEELYDASVEDRYPVTLYDGEIDILPMLEDMLHKQNPTIAISKFFNTIVEIINMISSEYDLPLVLSGGVFQNRVLLELILEKFPDAVLPNELPPNDGGIALGQVAAGG